MKINFVFGQIVPFEALPANSIALDGAVQGPQMDPATRRFSFDHHAGCVRMVTLATCQQVAMAIRLGLVVDEATEVFINDIDADTVKATWLLKHPERVDEPRVRELVERIGLTDAHGPIFGPHAIHRELAPAYGSKEPQTLAMLETFLAKVTQYADGEWREPAARPEQKSTGFGWSPKSGWKSVETMTGFDGLYKAGYLVGVLFTEAPRDSRAYTVGKRSDLVPFALGPSAKVKVPASVEDYRGDTLLGKLAQAELATNPTQALSCNWGGGSTVGGCPRNPDGSRSRLRPEEVLAICQSLTAD